LRPGSPEQMPRGRATSTAQGVVLQVVSLTADPQHGEHVVTQGV
jgi:hypothetical protein